MDELLDSIDPRDLAELAAAGRQVLTEADESARRRMCAELVGLHGHPLHRVQVRCGVVTVWLSPRLSLRLGGVAQWAAMRIAADAAALDTASLSAVGSMLRFRDLTGELFAVPVDWIEVRRPGRS